MNPILFLGGYSEIETDTENAAPILNAFLELDLPFSALSERPDGGIRLICASRDVRRISGRGRFAVRRRGGLPSLVLRLLRRPGLIVGGLLALALVIASRLFVWDVRVTGTKELSAGEITAILKESGFGIGSYIPDFSAGEVENRALLASDRLAWISVHMEGTVAKVQVLERIPVPTKELRLRPADLVARADGQIETVELWRGNPVVRAGQAVRRGELLVSGIFESETAGCRFTRAAGRVMARTEHSVTVQVPLRDVQKTYYAAERGDVWLNFFAFGGKISENTGNDTTCCDIIETETHFDLPFLQNLPLSLRVETRRLWREETVERTPEEALALAYDRLEAQLRVLSENAQLLSRQTVMTLTEDAVILECTVGCIEDIAEQVEFDVTD